MKTVQVHPHKVFGQGHEVQCRCGKVWVHQPKVGRHQEKVEGLMQHFCGLSSVAPVHYSVFIVLFLPSVFPFQPFTLGVWPPGFVKSADAGRATKRKASLQKLISYLTRS
jgi:hypothetical protein